MAFSALHFAPAALSESDLSAWEIALPAKLESAASKRRAEFLAGRLAARDSVAALCGAPEAPSQDAERLPRWPAGIIGSITHSHGLAAAVVGHQRAYEGLGLDAERLLTTERALRLAPQILVNTERAWLASLETSQQGRFVTLVFSLKESLFKALYPLVRQRFYFPDAQLSNWDPASGEVTITLRKTLSARWGAGTRLEGQVADLEDHLLTLIAIPRQS